eukprot:TRINITY_DN128676_c0_g1_i1.p1 TRINITY_DN128676_c0_g1~~TRINITY_DN128676_c0_g1_i1.p1  ORF type:complete len:172 (-),score=31.05 TRINITY_DN128676_c0_g1_i1:222-737(-)
MANAVLEFAKTGRSKCATTGAAIDEGAPRVGFEIWRMGRRCMTYQTPKAFLGNLQLGVAEDNRGVTCKSSGARIVPGDLFVVLSVGGAKGEKATTQSCKLENISALISSVAQISGTGFGVQKMAGFKKLPLGMQKKAAAMLAKGSKKVAAPVASKKRPAAADPKTGKKGKK